MQGRETAGVSPAVLRGRGYLVEKVFLFFDVEIFVTFFREYV